ncbi:hypothetical protein [Paracoccus sp. ME4]|uniref:hypothetical protein n=1 Tax=Paracoccus sp. ME4 TaxID=3138066 RepID=UPI00398B67D0
MPCLTQDEKDDIAVALLEVADRFGGNAPIDMLLIHRQAAEVCRIMEARDRSRIALPVQLPPITALSDLAQQMWRRNA